MFKSTKINLIFLCVTSLLLVGFFYTSHILEVKSQAANITLTGYAWSDNIGWIDFSPATTNGGVIVGTGGNLNGYAWSENIGWIKFGGLSSFPTATGTLSQNAQIVSGQLLGWIRACAGTTAGDCSNMTNHPDGWDGWISLGGFNHSISLSGTDFSGFAWGSDPVGWIDFSGVKLSTLAPITISFSGTPTSVSSGASTNIYWNSTGADSCNITKSGVLWATSSSVYSYIFKFGSYGSANGQFNSPVGVALDSLGNIYVLDSSQRSVQKFNSSGTFISKFGSYGAGDGQFNSPSGIAIDASDNIYIVDTNNNRIQKFNSSGTFISKFGSYGTTDGLLYYPTSMTFDSSGNILITDLYNYRVQKFTSTGTFILKFGSYGAADGQFYSPRGIAVDSSNNIYVIDNSKNNVQKFNSSGTFVSKFGSAGSGDGQFSSPYGIATDSSDNVYVVDRANNRIQKFTSNGTFISKFGSYGTTNGLFYYPTGIDFDSLGNMFVAELYNYRVQKFSPPIANTSGSKLSGAITVSTTFTATCINNINSTSSSVVVNIAAPIRVLRTAPSEIIWDTTADSCTLQVGTSTPVSVAIIGDTTDDTLMGGITITLRCMVGAQEYSTSTMSIPPAPPSTCIATQGTSTEMYVNRSTTWTMDNTAGTVSNAIWSGTNISGGASGNPFNKIYTTVGKKDINVTAVITRPDDTTFNSSCTASTTIKLDIGTTGEL